jgi:hypothetical protein
VKDSWCIRRFRRRRCRNSLRSRKRSRAS